MCNRGRSFIHPWLDSLFAMSYPYYSIPPQLYEHLPGYLGKVGWMCPSSPLAVCSLPEDIAGPPTIEVKTSRVLITNIDDNEIRISYYFDSTFNEYVGYALLVSNRKPLPKGLRRRLCQLLEKPWSRAEMTSHRKGGAIGQALRWGRSGRFSEAGLDDGTDGQALLVDKLRRIA